MKKTIIMTYYDAPNYGAFLQAFALQSFLKEKGVSASICKHKASNPNIFTRYLDRKTDTKVIEYRNCVQEAVNSVKDKLHVVSNCKEKYDLAILGSDEIWNVKNLTAIHYPLFFRKFKNADRTISYAACCGSTKVKHLRLFPYAVSGIRKLDAIAVRDDNTEALAKSITSQNVTRVLDPTFLFNFNRELPERQIKEKYLLIYTYGMDEPRISEIKSYAKTNGLLIVATGSYCEWADQNLIPNPFEWVSLLKNSEGVITSTFHGSVFSIIFNKQFVTIGENSAKIVSLLKELDISIRLIKKNDRIENSFALPLNYSKINDEVDILRKKSKKYILDNLGM